MENTKKISYSNFQSMIDGIKKQEYLEVKLAVEAHDGYYCWDVTTDDGCPIIAVNVNGFAPNPMDVCISKVAIVNDELVIEGVDKEYGNPVNFKPEDVFAGHLSFIIDYLPATESVTNVSQKCSTNVLFGEEAIKAYNEDRWEEFVESHEGYNHITRTFETEIERQAYYSGIIDCNGWDDYAFLDSDELLDDENLEEL